MHIEENHMKKNGKSEGFIKPRGFTLKCGDPRVVDVVSNLKFSNGTLKCSHFKSDESQVVILAFARVGREPGSETNLTAQEFLFEMRALNAQDAGYLVF